MPGLKLKQKIVEEMIDETPDFYKEHNLDTWDILQILTQYKDIKYGLNK